VTTAGDIINSSLRLIGVLAGGETPDADTSNDALTTFQAMLDSWNAERLSVYSTGDLVFTWPANSATQTIGPTGDQVATRPVAIDQSTYFKLNNLSYMLQWVNQDQYNGIALKTVTSTWPQVCFVNDTFPNITLTVYPVPTSATEWHVISVTPLTTLSSLATTVSLPPGYWKALTYNLALELAPQFGMEPPVQVIRGAVSSKRTIKRQNAPMDKMALPYPLVQFNSRWNIYSGSFG
jgi:hypothetical protein